MYPASSIIIGIDGVVEYGQSEYDPISNSILIIPCIMDLSDVQMVAEVSYSKK